MNLLNGLPVLGDPTIGKLSNRDNINSTELGTVPTMVSNYNLVHYMWQQQVENSFNMIYLNGKRPKYHIDVLDEQLTRGYNILQDAASLESAKII